MTVRKKDDSIFDSEYDDIDVFHVMPEFDAKHHATSENCWCEPKMIYKNPETLNEVWLHTYSQ